MTILGIPVHGITMEETLDVMKAMALSGESHHAMTVNPEFIMIARKDHEFRNVLCNASLVLPDGMGVVWAARLLGRRMEERIAGVDAVRKFARVARDHNIRIFLLGAAEGVAGTAASRLEAENPGLQIVGTYAGSPAREEEDVLCSMIESARPHVLLVAFGAPRQDLWIARTRARLNIPLAMGVGGTFDFIAGVAVRAPRWMQALGVEWLHRLIQEPHRWRRMLRLPLFACAVLGEKFLPKEHPVS